MPSTTPARIRSTLGRMRPREHGGWSLALEPVALGILAAPSWPGVALGAAVLAAFLARRPLQIVTGVSRQSDDPEKLTARHTLLFLALVAVALVVVTAGFAGPRALWPLGLALPPAALFLWLDAQGEARAAAAELAGTVAFALLPAAFVSLHHGRPAAALALSAVMAARSLPTVLALRVFLRRRKGQPIRVWVPMGAAAFTVAATIALASQQRAPWLAPAFAFVFFLRTLWLFGPRPPALRATRLGMLEAALGAAFVIAVGLTWPQS